MCNNSISILLKISRFQALIDNPFDTIFKHLIEDLHTNCSGHLKYRQDVEEKQGRNDVISIWKIGGTKTSYASASSSR